MNFLSRMFNRLQMTLAMLLMPFVKNTRALAINYKELLVAFFLYLISVWIGGYINSAIGLTAGGDLLRTLAFSFVPFLVFWIVWKKFGPKAEKAL